MTATTVIENRGQALPAAPGNLMTKLESLLVALILLGPVLGVLNPPEGYFWPATFDTSIAYSGREFPLTTLISHAVTLTIVFIILRNWRGYISTIKYTVPILLQISAFILSVLWSEESYTSLRAGFHLFQYFVLSLHIIYRYSITDFLRLLTFLFGISALLSFVAIVAAPGLAHSAGIVGYETAWRGVFSNKNACGAMASLAIICSGYSLLIGANRWRFALFVLVANLVLLIESRSATSWLTTAICGAVFCTIYLLRTFAGKSIVTLAVLGGGFMLIAAVSSANNLTDLLGRSTTLTGRTDVWAAVIPLIDAKPLQGYGLGFWDFDTTDKNNVWSQLGWATPHAHDDLLDVTLQTGMLGASFFILNYVLSICIGLIRFRCIEDGSVLLLIIIIDFIVRGLTETISVFPGSDQIVIIYCAQAYLWKLSFSGGRNNVSQTDVIETNHLRSDTIR